QRGERAVASPTIVRRSPEAVIPLTFAQQQIWLHAQLALDTPLYNEPFTVHRKGLLDVAALEQSFTEIIRRHEAWRTTFPMQHGQPVQMVNPPFEIKLPVVDLRNLPESERTAAALHLATEDARRPFDLAKGPLVRAHLVRLADEEYRLFVNCHHLIFDGVTGYQVFLPELVSLYEAFSNPESSTLRALPLPELPFQYGDYAVWQRESQKGEGLKGHLDYWRKQLSGTLPVLQLPTEGTSAGAESFRGAMQSFALSCSLREALHALSRRQGVTLFMTVLAALDTLLYRYSGQEDILIGSITSGRNHRGTEKLLGFFLNTVVLRSDLTGDPTFLELLDRVRRTTIEALSHDDVPLNQIMEELHPERSGGRNPLFRVLLSLEPGLSEVRPGWDLTPIDVETGTTKFDLCFVLDDRIEGVLGRVIYSTNLFAPATITQLIGCWQTLLEAIVADPSRRISQLPILRYEERRKLLVEWNDTRKPYPVELVSRQFELHAEKSPKSIAVRCGSQTLSYGELNHRASQLANYLRTLGVRAEVPVALCVERSLEMVIGILGILKAGGAYVPLDPAYPRERLDSMLADCQAPVMLTQQHLLGNQPRFKQAQVICLDSEWEKIARQPHSSMLEDLKPENLAYVIYTSGSTGGAKGVEVTQQNLAQSTAARLDYYTSAGNEFLLLSSFAFDSSVALIFHALCSGGALVLPAKEFKWEARQIAGLIAQHQISNMLCIPLLYCELLETVDAQQLASLHQVIVAGEVCPRQLVALHYQLLPAVELFNEYGPTEGTVWSTVYKCQLEELRSAVPIGRPIANTRVYVLDRNLQPVPTGVQGELYITGAGVARGYRNQADLTRSKFLSNPFAEAFAGTSDSRIYRTGDLVRYLPDGSLVFLGRRDEQVKIRGMRIELGEIELVLTEHPEVREAAVVMEGNSAKPLLVAYVVAREQYATSAAEMGAFLKSRLPVYMVPSTFVFVSALPRTPNGKVDRQALSSGSVSLAESVSAGPIAPRDSLEARLVTIWKEVLETESDDVTANFFELGGHSLLAAKLLYRIEQEFEQSLSLAFVFQAPTIELMADWLRSPDHSLAARAIIAIQPKGSRPPLFVVRGGPRFRLLGRKLGLDQPLLGLDIPYSDAIKLPNPYRVEDIAEFLVRAMREVHPHGPYHLAGLCVNAVIAYEVARQLQLEGEQVALLAMFDGHNHAYYKSPFRDGRYTGRIKYHLANLLQLDLRQSSAYISDRFEEARRKLERTMWRLSGDHGSGQNGKLRNTDTVVLPAFHRYEPDAYAGNMVLFQSSDWP
ncbi:MAG: amino acid adenylation domain-containing protein, partial [Candidatus Sulfotelmatobacter sp.]